MKYFRRHKSETKYIQLNSSKCKACWECQDVCSKNVLGKVNLPWHKHALIVNASGCIGCGKCVKICRHNALSKLQNFKIEGVYQ